MWHEDRRCGSEAAVIRDEVQAMQLGCGRKQKYVFDTPYVVWVCGGVAAKCSREVTGMRLESS
jgi:hypothetical protein